MDLNIFQFAEKLISELNNSWYIRYIPLQVTIEPTKYPAML